MQEHKSGAFLIATANDIESLPPELLRKGRFDEIFFVDLPAPVAREQIFKIHLKRRNQDPEHFELQPLVEVSDGYSGSEIEEAIRSAMFTAFAAGTRLSTRQIVEALKNSPPLSVTARERINWLRSWARDRCVPAD
jgi:SpoVK/Ycf46/Vps4 family AAA+-type ATPase